MADAPGRLRIDKWLWQARFFRTRGLAGEAAASGSIRLNAERVAKPSQPVRPGDVLTFPKAGRIRVIRVEALGTRRGPASEAVGLYTDLDPPEAAPPPAGDAGRDVGTGRPTKRERRKIDAWRQSGG